MTEVSFPGLGWTFKISSIAFTIFGRDIRWYGIIICFGMILCAAIAMLESRKNKFSEDTVADIMLITIPCSIIGARAYYVIFEWDYFKGNISRIFDLQSGGLAVYGGIILTILGVYIMCVIRNIPFDALTDYAIIYIPLGQAIGRWGNFFNQEAFGTTTTLPWGMTSSEVRDYLSYYCPTLDSNMPVHPTFLYESLCTLSLFFILHYIRKRSKFRYETTASYMIGYGIVRFFIEGLRTDSLYIGHTNVRTSQLLSIILVLAGFIIIIYSHYAELNRRELPEKCFVDKTAAQAEKTYQKSLEEINKEESSTK